jgi:L-threonylcarbamoyladenylate synthase
MDLRGVAGEDLDVTAAVHHVQAGGLLAYPTETVYGFGGACTADGVSALGRLKVRRPGQPFLALVPSADFVSALGWTDEARELASVFWPGALTLVLKDPVGMFPPGIRSEDDTVAVRVSPHPVVRALVGSGHMAITSTSANAPGQPPATTGDEASAVAQELGARGTVLVMDVGTLPPSGPSTIVDCTGFSARVLRAGTVPVDRLRCALPEIRDDSYA